MIKEAKLSAKCQVTIPKEVRELLKIASGDKVVFYFDENVIKVTSSKNLIAKAKDNKKTTTIQKDGK